MKYEIKYTRNGKDIKVSRNAETAQEAVEKLCDMYGWRCDLKQFDAETRGQDWAEMAVDTEGGINWNLRIIAKAK